jgi:hypothetical protein
MAGPRERRAELFAAMCALFVTGRVAENAGLNL